MIFARKMPEFYLIIARKIFFPNFKGERAPLLPVSYAYGLHFENPACDCSNDRACIFTVCQAVVIGNSVSRIALSSCYRTARCCHCWRHHWRRPGCHDALRNSRLSTQVSVRVSSLRQNRPPILRLTRQEAQLLLGDRATRKHAKDS